MYYWMKTELYWYGMTKQTQALSFGKQWGPQFFLWNPRSSLLVIKHLFITQGGWTFGPFAADGYRSYDFGKASCAVLIWSIS